MKKFFKTVLLILSLLILTACGGKQETKEITVYSNFEEDYIGEFLEGFTKQYPDIKVNLVRESAGVITSKIKAEKDNPQADVLWGIAITGVIENQDLFLPFEYDVKNIDSKFYDTKNEKPSWVGIDAWMTAFTFNKLEGEKRGIAAPMSYADLLKPEYQGEIVMPNPASSGTGFLTVSAWIQLMGEEKAWKYMDELNKNIKMYVHSGSAPTKMAIQGETTVGIGMGFESLRLEKDKTVSQTIFPKEGSGWEMEIVSILKKDEVKEEAKLFAQWAVSKSAMETYAKYRGFVTDNTVKPLLKGYPENVEKQMINNDLLWAAENKDRILKEWERRYGKGEN